LRAIVQPEETENNRAWSDPKQQCLKGIYLFTAFTAHKSTRSQC